MDLGVVEVDVSVSSDGNTYTPLCSAVNPNPDSKQVWSCSGAGGAFTGALQLGVNYIRATATNGEGTSLPSAAIKLTIVDKKDGEPPANDDPPTITSPADGVYTNDNTPSFSGSASGQTFQVTAGTSVTLCSGNVVDQTWACTADPALLDGTYTYRVTSDDLSSDARTIHVDTVAPVPPTINGFEGSVDSSPAPTISGLSEPGATVQLLLDGIPADCTAAIVANDSGAWSCTLAASPSEGLHELTATQTDLAGNTSGLSSPAVPLTIRDSTPPAPPIVTSPAGTIQGTAIEAITNDPTPTIGGTGEPGATITSLAGPCTETVTVSAEGDWSCTLENPLSPDGVFLLPFTQTDAAGNTSEQASPELNLTVDTTAPDAFELWTPTGTMTDGVIEATTTSTHPLISGMGELNATLRIYRDGSIPVACREGLQVSSASGFHCTPSAALGVGVHDFTFSQTDAAGNSSGSPVLKLRLTVLAPAGPPAKPTTPPAPPRNPLLGSLPTLSASWFLNFRALGGNPAPGQNITLVGSDLPIGAIVSAELHSTPISLGTSVVKGDGTFRLNTVIPNTVIPGQHHYIVTVAPLEGSAQTVEVPVTIVAATPAAIPAPAPVPTIVLPPLKTPAAAQDHRDEPAAPNVLSWVLPTAQNLFIDPRIIGAALASSLALLFLVAFPAELLNSTIEENYGRLFGRLPKPKLAWLTRIRRWLANRRLVGGLALTTLAALIFSFADPHFGFDLSSLRLFLACIIGMFVLGYAANAITGAILKRRWNITSIIQLEPFGLVVALVGVLLSRLLDFTPGLLVGLVLGLSLSASATLRDEAREVLIWAAIVLGISVASWVVYSLMSGVVAPNTFAGALFDDSLVAVAVEGISGLVVGLLPIGYLDGASLFRRTKVQWALTYLVSLVAFFLIVLPSGQLWGQIDGPFWIWATVLFVFAAVCVGVYLWFRAHPEREEAGEVGDGESTDEVAAQVGGGRAPVK
nr:FGLLP motif-containing membrane protein [Terrimesophilobacter mesophilus]